ncbi:MAG: ATP-dependent DNA helicase RecQ [Saprospiraceae bacterium]
MSTAPSDSSDFRQNATQALERVFGWSAFRDGQLEVLEALHEHKCALALFPTGGGKSLCYQLYSQLVPTGLTLVVSPLIALMKDQVDDLRSRGISAARIDSSLEWEELRTIKDDIRSGEMRILYVAPERFNNENFRELVEGVEISLFAVDEAHCISQWGHNFRPDYLKLVEFAERLEAKAVLALTATATPSVVEDIQKALKIPQEASIITSAYRPNLFIEVNPQPIMSRTDILIERLQDQEPGTTIVYVTLQRTAQEVTDELVQAGLPAKVYHAGLKPDERAKVQESWMLGRNRIVVATIAFGMGIDKSDVRYIYHFNLPKSLESYVQEIGRAGRDGQPSRVELLGNGEDVAQLASFTLGDTPADSDLLAFVDHILGQEEHFEVSTYHLARNFDIRQLTLGTVLTYMELLGIIKQGTPRYTGYQITPIGGKERILNRVSPSAKKFYQDLFAVSKVGYKHITVDMDVAEAKTEYDRDKILKGINYLDGNGLAYTKPSGLKKGYKKFEHDFTVESLTEELIRRFAVREKADLDRLQLVVDFAETQSCKTAYILRYFGDEDPADCGHCAWCADKNRDFSTAIAAMDSDISDVLFGEQLEELQTLIEEKPKALGDPRKVTRYLLGITSPATGAARITRNRLFGLLNGFGYETVDAFVKAM